jgi:taurine dioxygenase
VSYDAITVTAMTPRIGAEITGLDLTKPLSNHQATELEAALVEHQVLFFRDQPLDLDSHQALGRHFGALHVHPNVPGPSGYPAVLPIHTDATSRRIAGEAWHSDVSCDEQPPLGSILHLHIVPPTGGDTLFASMFAAYDALSPRMKTYLDGLTATHAGEHVYRSHNERDAVPETGRAYPRAVHPVIRTHPVSKRRALFVNATFTTRINELPADESRAILSYLYEHATRPEFQVRFRWRPNSVAFWDNRSTQHMALWDYFPETRSGFRVTIKGDRPV